MSVITAIINNVARLVSGSVNVFGLRFVSPDSLARASFGSGSGGIASSSPEARGQMQYVNPVRAQPPIPRV